MDHLSFMFHFAKYQSCLSDQFDRRRAKQIKETVMSMRACA